MQLIFLTLRIVLGLFFVWVGCLKLLSPYQNFLYVVQSYEIFPTPLEGIIAHGMPWVEFFVGVFLLLGLWLRWALCGEMLMTGGFILVIGQALLRKLPIEECGCFGEAFSLPLSGMIFVDGGLLLAGFVLWRNLSQTRRFSLDEYYSKPSEDE